MLNTDKDEPSTSAAETFEGWHQARLGDGLHGWGCAVSCDKTWRTAQRQQIVALAERLVVIAAQIRCEARNAVIYQTFYASSGLANIDITNKLNKWADELDVIAAEH